MSEQASPAYLPCQHICMRGSDVGIYVSGDPVAYAHPDCSVHGITCDCGHGKDVHFQDGCVDKSGGGYFCECLAFEPAP